jgi:hypothetical protein
MRTQTELAIPWRDLLFSLGLGLALGAFFVLLRFLGLSMYLGDALRSTARGLHDSVGPVWIPMALVGLRVSWLAGHALASRWGHAAPRRPVRGELSQLAPLFAALGLCGTVWGLSRAFDALEGGEFLGQLPALLGGLGAAMTSTLAGLGLQIGTLLLATVNPVSSTAHIGSAGDALVVALDGQRLGVDEAGVGALIEALGSRQPEALRVSYDRALSASQRELVRERLWSSLDADLDVRERPA